MAQGRRRFFTSQRTVPHGPCAGGPRKERTGETPYAGLVAADPWSPSCLLGFQLWKLSWVRGDRLQACSSPRALPGPTSYPEARMNRGNNGGGLAFEQNSRKADPAGSLSATMGSFSDERRTGHFRTEYDGHSTCTGRTIKHTDPTGKQRCAQEIANRSCTKRPTGIRRSSRGSENTSHS